MKARYLVGIDLGTTNTAVAHVDSAAAEKKVALFEVPQLTAPGEVARGAPVNGVLVLYGNQRCPTDDAGNEIVVCTRRSAQEQFRVPKELRELQITPENESWAVRSQTALEAGAGVNTIGSCSAVGPGGQTGCFNQRVRESRRENAARAAERSREPQ